MAYLMEDDIMRYQCDICGCYLDPAEGRTCDECQAQREQRSRKRKGFEEVVRLDIDNQYCFDMEVIS